MNDREIVAAALRWHTTHLIRMNFSSALYANRKCAKQQPGCYSSNEYSLSLKVTEAKRLERAALRQLAKLCKDVRGSHIDDASPAPSYIDVQYRLVASSIANQ